MARLLTRPQGRLSDEAPPPQTNDPGEGGGGGGEWALLTVAPNQVLAHLIRGCLAQEGIDAVLDDHNLSPGAWLHPFGDPLSPVRILVRRADLTAASLTLHDLEDLGEPGRDEAAVREQASGAGPRAAASGLGPLSARWGRIVLRGVMALVAAAAIGSMLVFGPCVSHWFCV